MRYVKIIGIAVLLTMTVLFSFFFGAMDAHTSQSPSVITHSATNIGSSSAVINGYFNPHGSHTQGWFEWGRTTSLGNFTAQTGGSLERQFDRTISDLIPNTTYHFRAVAENLHGREHGQIRSFTTGPLLSVYGFEDISIKKFVRSLNDNNWRDSVTVAPGSAVSFRIEVRSIGSSSIHNVIVKNILPDRINYFGDLRVDGLAVFGNIETGLNIGTISANSMKVVTFQAVILSENSFGIGSTNLINSAFASSGGKSVNDTAGVFVVRGIVAGVATNIKTGIADNKLIDFFLLPLLLTLIIFFLFKKHFSGLVDWMDDKKEILTEKKAEKRLDQVRELVRLKEKLN